MGSSELMIVLVFTRVSGLIIHDGWVPAGRGIDNDDGRSLLSAFIHYFFKRHYILKIYRAKGFYVHYKKVTKIFGQSK